MSPRNEWECVECGSPGVGFDEYGQCLCTGCLFDDQDDGELILPDDVEIRGEI